MAWLSRIFGFSSTVVVVNAGTAPLATTSPQGLSAAVRAISLLSTDVARIRATVVDAKGNQIASHPVADLLNRQASRWQNGYEYRRWTSAVALENGNAISLIRRHGTEVAELQPIPPGAVTAQFTEDGPLYRIGGETLDASQVLHIGAFPNPLNPGWYRGAFDVAYESFCTAMDENGAHRSLVKTGLPGKIAITTTGVLDDPTVERIRNNWLEMHSSSGGASRPLVLRGGYTATSLNDSNRNQLDEARKFSIAEVGRAFGVPPEMLYQAGGGALTSQAETARAYVDGGLAQWVAAWESEVTTKLLRPGERLKLDTRALMRGNLRDQGIGLSKLAMGGVMTPNEAREVLDLPPVAGGDVLKVTMPGGGLGQDAQDAQDAADAANGATK